MKKPAVFIDRDGTVNEQMGFVNHPSRFVILPGVAEALRMLNDKGYLAIIVSNQSGVARGYFPIELLYNIHSLMEETLLKKGAKVDGIYFCPHYPNGSIPEYSFECDCRKPKTDLIDQACKDFDIDIPRSFVIGDHNTDIELADRLNIKGILVKTGYGSGVVEYNLASMGTKPYFIAEDLLGAIKWTLKNAVR